ncbi:hypothetical protein [Actinophytocola sediminis]
MGRHELNPARRAPIGAAFEGARQARAERAERLRQQAARLSPQELVDGLHQALNDTDEEG